MDYLQYLNDDTFHVSDLSFKPYYKWITFNTHWSDQWNATINALGFKPYYKWITFNTESNCWMVWK